jgi:hypothetical protein
VAQIAQAYGAASCAQYLDLEDEAVRGASGHAGSDAPGAGGELEPAQAARIAARAQRASERASARARADAMAREQSLEDLLAFAGRPE